MRSDTGARAELIEFTDTDDSGELVNIELLTGLLGAMGEPTEAPSMRSTTSR